MAHLHYNKNSISTRNTVILFVILLLLSVFFYFFAPRNTIENFEVVQGVIVAKVPRNPNMSKGLSNVYVSYTFRDKQYNNILVPTYSGGYEGAKVKIAVDRTNPTNVAIYDEGNTKYGFLLPAMTGVGFLLLMFLKKVQEKEEQ